MAEREKAVNSGKWENWFQLGQRCSILHQNGSCEEEMCVIIWGERRKNKIGNPIYIKITFQFARFDAKNHPN